MSAISEDDVHVEMKQEREEDDMESLGVEDDDDDEEYDYESDADDDDEDGPAIAAPTNTPADVASNEYRIISPDLLRTQKDDLVRDVASILSVSVDKASLLLRHLFWDKEKLLNMYWSDPEAVDAAAGACFTGKEVDAATCKYPCMICMETPASGFTALGCQHLFCRICWVEYLQTKISEGPLCVTTTCPQHGCKERVSDSVFKKLLPANEYKAFDKYLLRSFVDINRSIRWCPAPGCNNAIVSSGGLTTVSCSCGCLFCLRCGEEAHAPVTCDQLALWQEKCKNESETANWILANTKKCPKCSVRIEKNQGCNHMTCRGCKYEFCWICMDVWSNHNSATGGYYKCNRYDPAAAPQDTDAARAKAELDRYLHYYQRYANHAEAGRYALRMRENTDARMTEFEAEANGSYMDVGFLNAAIEAMVACRRVLKYSYVYAYYLSPGPEKNLFEYLQEDLERNTEHLTHLAEKPLNEIDRSELNNYTRVTEKFLKNLLGDVDDGLVQA
ncbi:hypothetical protein SPRG_11280 [Saprolegnia parasitica CBS 223.65]|uniref:RBR-type E3 ubiquitin transferase n=1 Tax=Saprolegnia parasitica (strain CBS 223.65) TaxID=695850 RepID=A0A067BZZ9_SAPPC|nr:hypothetical protein SPRG_11280 [Saprolegnia parasitica CBS 223.65]KDO23848.1 hypothetical protein SPRG_11280 [Saprolegnia parasitica CBS 223.65]|eukprot:XP_012205481.1 hypothetical protein SPRG_11280 [Saprolegnia parasitica CBS 223.65]